MNLIEVHMIAGEGYYLACGASPEGFIISMTEEFEKVTCIECQIKWLTYERDQYKEMWEREKEGNSSGRQVVELQQCLERQRNTIRRMTEENEQLRRNADSTSTGVVTIHRHNPYTEVGTLCGSFDPNDRVRSTSRVRDITCQKCLSLMS